MKNLAVASRAVKQIQAIESELEAKAKYATPDELDAAMSDMAKLAKAAADEAAAAIAILKRLKPQVVMFRDKMAKAVAEG